MIEDTPDFSSDLSLDDLLVQVADTHSNPNIGKVYTAKLKEGPQVSRVAVIREILDAKTGRFHHYSLSLSSYKRLKAGWFTQKERSIAIESGKDDEINKLIHFLRSVLQDSFPRCLVPECDGDVKCTTQIIKETLWDKFYMAAPLRQRRFAGQYKIVKKA